MPPTQRLRVGGRAPGDGAARTGLQVRPRRSRLPQALLRRPPRRPRRPTALPGRGSNRGDGRHLQRTQHQPHRTRDRDPKLRPRHRLSARRARGGSGYRLATRRVRPRPAVPRHGRRRRSDVVVVGAWAVSPVGADGRPQRRTQWRSAAHAVPQRVRVDRPLGCGPADPLHAGALRRRVVDGLLDVAGRGRGRHLHVVPRTEVSRADPQRAASGRHRLHPAERLGHRHPPRLELPLHLAAVRLCGPLGVLRRRARRTFRARGLRLAADPRHEPDLHRQGRLLHRHQAGQPRRGGCRARRRTLRGVRRPAGRCALSRSRPGQGVGAVGLGSASRRHHRQRIRPGVPRSAHRVARRLGVGHRRAGRCAGGAVRGGGNL